MSKKKTIIIISSLVVFALLTVLVVCLSTCRSEKNDQGQNDETSETSATSEPVETENDWDKATQKWVPNTALEFELRVRPGHEYEIEQHENNQGCLFRTSDGKEVYILVQGLDYKESFDALIAYFKSNQPEKLTVGKTSKTVIVEYDRNQTEIVSKLGEKECLTTKTSDVKTAEEFFSSVMIKVAGKDILPLDLSEKYDEIN